MAIKALFHIIKAVLLDPALPSPYLCSAGDASAQRSKEKRKDIHLEGDLNRTSSQANKSEKAELHLPAGPLGG